MIETLNLPPTSTESRQGPRGRGDFVVHREWAGESEGMWYGSSITARVMRGAETVHVIPVSRATSPDTTARYSRGVYARFAAFSAFITIALVLGVMSLIPDLRDLAFGALVAAMFAALAGLSGAERAQFERRRRVR